jgi:hypothetical protein
MALKRQHMGDVSRHNQYALSVVNTSKIEDVRAVLQIWREAFLIITQAVAPFRGSSKAGMDAISSSSCGGGKTARTSNTASTSWSGRVYRRTGEYIQQTEGIVRLQPAGRISHDIQVEVMHRHLVNTTCGWPGRPSSLHATVTHDLLGLLLVRLPESHIVDPARSLST